MCAVLSWPRGILIPTHQEPDINSGGRVATVSLRKGLPCQRHRRFSTECLLTSAESIAHMYKVGKGTAGRPVSSFSDFVIG